MNQLNSVKLFDFRMSSSMWLHYSEHKSMKSHPSDCEGEVSNSDKRKEHNARKAQAWRDRLKKDPAKFAEYKALEAARAREYRRKKTAAARESDRENNRERQRRLRAIKKLQQCKAEEELSPTMIRKVSQEEKYYILGEETPYCH